MTTSATKIYGLVFAGGKSTRMGEDKGLISWHGIPQRNYTAQLLGQFCDEVFISCREEQVAEIGNTFQTITDSVDGKGPMVGILSAFKKYPDVAWLVMACDLPLIDEKTIAHLIKSRDASVIATTYISPHDGLPEPLITIWEPSSVDALNSFREQGYNCPRKVLINSNAKIIEPTSSHALMNANTPEDAAEVKKILLSKSGSTHE